MTLAGYRKHANIPRANMGSFGRHELSIVGAPCSEIHQLAGHIITALDGDYNLAYVDARHDDEPEMLNGNPAQAAAINYTGQTNRHEFDLKGEISPYQYRRYFNGADLVLVNGNHYQATQQVVIINSRKKQSLQKRMEQLTDVRLFLLADGETDLFDFVKEAHPNWKQIPVLRLDETEMIVSLIKTELQRNQPQLNGLVLAGGKSQRMGTDKAAINWHGKEQVYYAADLLKPLCNEVFISCRPDQQADIDPDYNTLPDTFANLGPMGAILSAFREKPDSAWLVIACDLPLLDNAALQQLVHQRSIKHLATAFLNPESNFPEPLITIWEPKSYLELLTFLAQGYSCPRKVLINSDVKVISALNPNVLTNVNTPEEMAHVQSVIQNII